MRTLRVCRDDQDLVLRQVQLAEVQLRLCPRVVGIALALKPAQQAPLSRGDVALRAPIERVVDPMILRHDVQRLRAVEREWLILRTKIIMNDMRVRQQQRVRVSSGAVGTMSRARVAHTCRQASWLAA